MRSKKIKRKLGISRRNFFSKYFSEYFRKKHMKETLFRVSVVAAIILFLFGLLGLLRPGIKVRVDAETVAAFRVPHTAINILQSYAERSGISFAELFAVFNAENGFFPEKHVTYDLSVLERLYVSDFNSLMKRYNTRSITPYISMFENLFNEIEVFPIPKEAEASVMFGDSWGVDVNLQGHKKHMGTAIIDRENIRGRISVVSMTSGTVRDAGWDNNLGYHVGIVTENNTYYLYAHLDSIFPGISSGLPITAGTLLGKMGNSGGGRSSFPVHLHVAISPDVSFTRGDFWLNPYPLLRYIHSSNML